MKVADRVSVLCRLVSKKGKRDPVMMIMHQFTNITESTI